MPTTLNPSPEEHKPHYQFVTSSLSRGRFTSGTKGKTKSSIDYYYTLDSDNKLLKQAKPYGIFHSPEPDSFFDEEFAKLKIKHQTAVQISLALTVEELPNTSLFISMMSGPNMEIAGFVLVCGGLAVLAASLIALIPVIASTLAIVGISSGLIAGVGGIILGIGIATALTNNYATAQSYKAEKKLVCEATIEQVDNPKSKVQASPVARNHLFNLFYPKQPRSEESAKPVVEIVEDGTATAAMP